MDLYYVFHVTYEECNQSNPYLIYSEFLACDEQQSLFIIKKKHHNNGFSRNGKSISYKKINKTHGKFKFMLQQMMLIDRKFVRLSIEFQLSDRQFFLMKSTMIGAINMKNSHDFGEIVTFIRYYITVSSINTLFAPLKFDGVDDIRNNLIIMICFTVDGCMAHDFQIVECFSFGRNTITFETTFPYVSRAFFFSLSLTLYQIFACGR